VPLREKEYEEVGFSKSARFVEFSLPRNGMKSLEKWNGLVTLTTA
jgi:hypothetical protein